MRRKLAVLRAFVSGVLLAPGAGGAAHAQSAINLTGYVLVFSGDFASASWIPNNLKGSCIWHSPPPTAGNVFGSSVREQNCLSTSNGVLVDKLAVVTGADTAGSYCGGPVGMKNGPGLSN